MAYDEAATTSGGAIDWISRSRAAMSSPPLSPTAKKNVETIAQVEQQLVGRRTRMDRIADAIARFFGTLRFIVAHALFFTGWFVLNLGLLPDTQPFDPYPFSLLGLIVGIEFIFLTTFVLMNQNLQSRRAEQWAHLNLQLAMLAEHGVTKNMQMLHMICKHLGIKQPTGDKEVKELAQATPVTTLVEEIANKLGETKHEATPGE
jgi:uncharacterized membrane protein